MAPDNVAVAPAKRVVKRTKVVEQKVIEISLPGSQEEEEPGLAQSKLMEVNEVIEERGHVTRTVTIEDKEAENRAQHEQDLVLNQAREEQKEGRYEPADDLAQEEGKRCVDAQNQMLEQGTENPDEAHKEREEVKSTEAEDQAHKEREKGLGAQQGEEMVKISAGPQTQAEEEPEKERKVEAEEAQKEQEKETAQEPKLDTVVTQPREEPKKRAREDDEAQENIPTPPRQEGEAQPKKRARKAQEKAEGGDGKKRKRRSKKVEEEAGKQDYKRYIRRVMKTTEPEMRISSGAITVINSFMNDVFEKLVEEAAKLSVQTGKKTLTTKEIQGAVRLLLPGELAKHALAEGNKAWANYLRFSKK